MFIQLEKWLAYFIYTNPEFKVAIKFGNINHYFLRSYSLLVPLTTMTEMLSNFRPERSETNVLFNF